MKDRVPGAPGQYKATVSAADLQKMQAGEQFAITMARDDQPIVEGTPYSKAAVLPDEVAEQLCPDIEDPTPADAFAAVCAALDGKAPAGYGLGTASKFVSNLNACLVNGWYMVRQSTENVPAGFDFGSVFVVDRNIEGAPEQVVQFLYANISTVNYDGLHVVGCMMIRSTTDGGKTWRERWVNPPFEVGVEYVTIEERKGRAVIKMLGADGVLRYKLSGESSWKTYAQEMGAAPAGFGLGGDAAHIPSGEDINDYTANGYYWWSGGVSNTPFAWGYMEVRASKESSQCTQIAHDMNNHNVVYMRSRVKEWGEWVDCSPSAFAPAGYGLGEPVPKIVSTPDEARLNGFYSVYNDSYDGDGSFSDWRLGYAHLFVQRRGSYVVQTLRFEDTEWQRFSSDEGNTWSPFEWVNPPMMAGVEYRTTERYEGKPVYAYHGQYAVSRPEGTSLSGRMEIETGATDCYRVIRAYGYLEDTETCQCFAPGSECNFSYSEFNLLSVVFGELSSDGISKTFSYTIYYIKAED